MLEEEVKKISTTLDKVCERLSQLESGSQGHYPYLNALDPYAQQWCPYPNVPEQSFLATAGLLHRSTSLPSILQLDSQDTEQKENQQQKFQFLSGDQVQHLGQVRPGHTGAHNLPSCYPHLFVPQYTGFPLQDVRGSAPVNDLKPRYEAIRNLVNKVVLDSDWCITESKQGIASGDRELATVISRSAKFVETDLRLMIQMQEHFNDDAKVAEILDQLHLVQKAHMRYLQEEYSSLQVGGQYSAQAKSVFKSIRRNTSVYTPAFIDDIKTVLSITGTQHPPQCYRPPSQWFQPRQGNFNRFQGSFRPGNPPRFRNPGAHYQPRLMPMQREDVDS